MIPSDVYDFVVQIMRSPRTPPFEAWWLTQLLLNPMSSRLMRRLGPNDWQLL